MNDEFVPLGRQSSAQIEAKLQELHGNDRVLGFGEESMDGSKNPWLNTEHQYGFIAPFTPGTQRYFPITSASNMAASEDLKGKRINIRLDHLRVYRYPTPLFGLGNNLHTILFSFEARNQVEKDREEPVVFNQLYKARSGQNAAVTGQPVFIGLTVGRNGVGFNCKTVNVSNSTDEKFVEIFNSDVVKSGLNLLSTAQPALAPLSALARGMCISLVTKNRNEPVQEVNLGLDFETGALGARLAVGSYVVAQTSVSGEIVWNEWVYDAETGTIMRNPKNLDAGEKSYPLPFNAFVFRVSPYIE